MPGGEKMNRMTRLVPGLLLALAVAGCDETLAVDNLIDPDVDRVFATPASIEQTIASGYQSCHNAHVVNADLNTQLLVMAFESYSQLNNFFMGPRGSIPRSPVVNVRGTDGAHFNVFSRLSRGGRLAVNALNALDLLLTDPTKTLGTPDQDIRARAFAFFVIGCNQGWLAMVYDSAGIVTPGMASDVVPPLSGAQAVMANAIAMFDSAIVQANLAAATSSGGFPLPDAWFSGNTHTSRDNFVRLVRSFRAHFRANVARNAAERAAVNWAAVIQDAENGIQADFAPQGGGSTGWNTGFVGSQMHVEPGWSQMSLMYFGMADQAGGCYDLYIATPLAQRNPECLIITADQRWPAGATRAAQQASSTQPTGLSSRPYVSNRSIQDAPAEPWGYSFYDFFRMKYIRNTSGTQGVFPDLMKAAIDLLAAEGYIRRNGAGDIQLAAAKIDISRVGRGGLPPLTGTIVTNADPVPGGATCVPRVPQGPGFTTNACGNIMEAMKWEYRMETAYTALGSWYFAGRGWSDLIEGTAVEFPVPFQELDALSKPYYGLGGGGLSSAPKGTYGF
jgi:hypothetical protein